MLKIRLALADKDDSYMNRLSNYFNANYSDKLEVLCFTNTDSLINSLNTNKINILLASENFEINTKILKGNLAFAYLMDTPGIETFQEKKAICKFQKAELIYKEILNLYSDLCEKAGVGFKASSEGDTVFLSFLSCSGGVGGSTLAASCCFNLAARGSKVLYLNLEQFGTPNIFFNGSGSFSLSDVFFAVKSKKNNLSLKLESTVKRDDSGVYFYDTCSTPMDIYEMTSEEVGMLFQEIRKSNLYDYVVVDTNLHLNDKFIQVMTNSNRLIYVSDGSEVSNYKLKRIYETLNILENQCNVPFISKSSLLYNQYNNVISKQAVLENEINILGFVGEYNKMTSRNIAIQIASTEIFSQF